MKRESNSEMHERLLREEKEKMRSNAAKERVRQFVIAFQNRSKTDEERKRDTEIEDAVLGKNATLNEREAFRGALTKAMIENMTNNEDFIRNMHYKDADFVERWTGTKSSKKQSTERKQ